MLIESRFGHVASVTRCLFCEAKSPSSNLGRTAIPTRRCLSTSMRTRIYFSDHRPHRRRDPNLTRSSVSDSPRIDYLRPFEIIDRRFTAASSRPFHNRGSFLEARNHSKSRAKFSFDPDLGEEDESLSLKEKISTVNEAVIFEHYNPKGRRLPRVYVWGCAETGALGAAEFLHPRKPKVKGEYWQRNERAKKKRTVPDPIHVMTRPYRMPHPDFYDLNISHVCAGHGFTIMVNSNNKSKKPRVVGTGLNFESQLGCVRFTDKTSGEEKIIDVLLEPTDISLPLAKRLSQVTQVSCGRAHSVFLTDEGVFTMGSNSQGQCGRKIIENEVFRGNSVIHKVESIPNDVVQVVCGLDHTLFLTSTGSVYSCGWGADGQTGIGHYHRADVPTLVKGEIEGVKIRQLACKSDCVLAVSDGGDLFGWGNSEYNQLSIVTPSTQVHQPRHLPFSVGRVVKAAAAASACAILNDRGRVFVWGFGILGLGPNVESLSEPQPLPPPLFGISALGFKLSVVDIQAGMSHFAAVVETPKKVIDHRLNKEIPPFRELYTWGANRRGCLGLGREENQPFPMKVILPASVSQVSCGTNHTVALCDPLLM